MNNLRQTTITTTKGPILGTSSKGISVFKGIPYAKPPVGQLRFTPPQEMEPWKEPLSCTEFGSCATQVESILVNTKPSEDCLYLNVWAPENAVGKKLPVFFWIHGGGFFNGCGTMNYYDGTPFAEKDIIVVTINYRLGALGFLALETSKEQYGTTGNWGTLDQIAALKWTNENIEAFGGDPDNITIAGESAGSFSISNLVMSPLTKGMFKQAIMESGSILSNKVAVPFTESNLDKSIEVSRKYAAIFGADDSKEGLEKLRSVDAYKLWETGYFSADATEVCPLAFWPALDGHVLPTDPMAALKAGNYNKANFLIGFNLNEGIVFMSEKTTEEGIQNYIDLIFKEKAEVVREYYNKQGMSNFEILPDVVTYSFFKAGMTIMKDEFSKQGNTVYSYQFNFTPDGNYPMSMLGAHHAVEIPYVFGTNKLAGLTLGEKGNLVEKQTHTLWSNFIKTGNPNTGLDLPMKEHWYTYTKEEPKTYYISTEVSCQDTVDSEKIKFFEGLLYN